MVCFSLLKIIGEIIRMLKKSHQINFKNVRKILHYVNIILQ